MFDLNNIVSEYFEDDRILHLTARKPVRCRTVDEGYALGARVATIMQSCFGGKPGYLITDLSKIIIEPDFISAYAAEIKIVFDTYLYPGGFARYGFEISRITARLGHELYLGGSVNLFTTKEEAFKFIRSLIARKPASPTESGGESDPESLSGEDAALVPVRIPNIQSREDTYTPTSMNPWKMPII